MSRYFRFYLNLICFLPLTLWGQLILEVTQLPATTPAGSDVYVAGSFNDWNPGHPDYLLSETPDGPLRIELDLTAGSYEFKFTRGDWPTVEGTAEGNFRPNRQITYGGGEQVVSLVIDGWEGLGGGNGTAAPNVELLSDNFYMPQLDRSRRIWVYLPPDYYTSDREYPVLYMHDGQNLFDQALSFSGEWEVDESLNELFDQGDPGIIVVGIDNGGGERINEYTPWSNPQYGGGQGAQYVDFIVETLKPYVDDNYRTKSDQPNTGIMGSSLGGLISLYACIRHQDVFGRAGVLSPSLWFTDDIFDFVSTTGKQADLRIALLAGEQESATMVPLLNDMYDTLLAAGFGADELRLVTHADGQHSEWYWRREFPTTYQWLFNLVTFLEGSPVLDNVTYWPNPTADFLRFDGIDLTNATWRAAIYDTRGRRVRQTPLNSPELNLEQLPAGGYFVLLWNQDRQWSAFHLQKI